MIRSPELSLLNGAMTGCGGGSSCDSQLALDPTGTWRGTLRRTNSTCSEVESGPNELRAEHEIYTECSGGGGSTDEEIRLIDQNGRTYTQKSYSIHLNGTVSFSVAGERSAGEKVRSEVSRIDYEDVWGALQK